MTADYEEYARVARQIDEYRCVLNRGAQDEIESGEQFLIFRVGDMVVDPVTGEELGNLEIVIGKVRVIHVQDRICTVESNEKLITRGDRRIIKRLGGLAAFAGATTEEVEDRPREEMKVLDAQHGDYAKPI